MRTVRPGKESKEIAAATSRRGTPHAAPEQRRAQILQSAAQCFGKHGYAGTTIDAVADHAGLSKGSVYRFFASKDDLMISLFDLFEAEILAGLNPGGDGAVLGRLEEAGRRAIELMASAPQLGGTWLEFIGHPASRTRLARLYEDSRRVLAELICEGRESGELRNVDPNGAAAAVLGTLEGLLLQFLVETSFDVRSAWPAVWDITATGLARTSATNSEGGAHGT